MNSALTALIARISCFDLPVMTNPHMKNMAGRRRFHMPVRPPLKNQKFVKWMPISYDESCGIRLVKLNVYTQYLTCTPAKTERPVPGSNKAELALAISVMLALAM